MERFELRDRLGAAHVYGLELHPGSTGMALALRVQALAVEPIVEALRAALALPQLRAMAANPDADTGMDAGALIVAIVGELQGLDTSRIAPALAAALGAKDGPDLVRALLAHTWRDGKALSEPMHMDSAYRGNYGELMQAVFQAVQRNGFFPLAELFASTTSVPTEPEPKAKMSGTRRLPRS